MLHRGCRQCGVKTDATDSYEFKRFGCCTHGKEHDDAQGYQRSFGMQCSSGKVSIIQLAENISMQEGLIKNITFAGGENKNQKLLQTFIFKKWMAMQKPTT